MFKLDFMCLFLVIVRLILLLMVRWFDLKGGMSYCLGVGCLLMLVWVKSRLVSVIVKCVMKWIIIWMWWCVKKILWCKVYCRRNIYFKCVNCNNKLLFMWIVFYVICVYWMLKVVVRLFFWLWKYLCMYWISVV